MSRPANALWASAAIGLALTGTAVAQTSPTTNDNNDNKNDPKNRDEPATTDDSTSPRTPAAPNTNPTTTGTPSTGTTGTPGAVGTTDVPGQAGTSGVAGNVTAQGAITVPPPAPMPPPPTAIQQPTTYLTVNPAPAQVNVVQPEAYGGPASGVGLLISAGGGAGGFVTDQLRNTTNVGGDWDVRATVGTRSILAFEGSYIGSAQTISALGLSNGATLVGNGVQGDVRLNGTLNLPVQPFVYAGAAWRRYDLTNTTTNTSDVRGSDDVLEVPMGLGIASHFGRAILDLRGEFRATTGEDLLPQTVGNSTGSVNMNRWDAKATIGLEF